MALNAALSALSALNPNDMSGQDTQFGVCEVDYACGHTVQADELGLRRHLEMRGVGQMSSPSRCFLCQIAQREFRIATRQPDGTIKTAEELWNDVWKGYKRLAGYVISEMHWYNMANEDERVQWITLGSQAFSIEDIPALIGNKQLPLKIARELAMDRIYEENRRRGPLEVQPQGERVLRHSMDEIMEHIRFQPPSSGIARTGSTGFQLLAVGQLLNRRPTAQRQVAMTGSTQVQLPALGQLQDSLPARQRGTSVGRSYLVSATILANDFDASGYREPNVGPSDPDSVYVGAVYRAMVSLARGQDTSALLSVIPSPSGRNPILGVPDMVDFAARAQDALDRAVASGLDDGAETIAIMEHALRRVLENEFLMPTQDEAWEAYSYAHGE